MTITTVLFSLSVVYVSFVVNFLVNLTKLVNLKKKESVPLSEAQNIYDFTLLFGVLAASPFVVAATIYGFHGLNWLVNLIF
jgi:hypothetical protein